MGIMKNIAFSFILSSLALNQVASEEKDWDETVCMFTHCLPELMACEINLECLTLIQCLGLCADTDAGCAFSCNAGGTAFSNTMFRDFMDCAVENGCESNYPDSGVCLAENSQAIQTQDWDMVKGDWWVVYGQNCGQEGWEGAFDAYPCTHGRIIEVEEDKWINNNTFCTGEDSSSCADTYFVQTPNVFWVEPGVLRNEFLPSDAPLTPQIQDWKIIWAKEDFMFVIWCGSNPLLIYNGAFLLSRTQSDGTLPSHLEPEIRAVVADFGLDLDAMCILILLSVLTINVH